MSDQFLYDGQAVDRIRDLMNSGQDWNAAMLEQIADIVRATNRTVQKTPRKLPPESTQQKP
jgi:ATP phosphoribosyltransferase